MKIVRALTILFTIGNVASAGTMPKAFEEVREIIERSIERDRVPSITIAVIQDGRIVWADGFGTAQFDTETPATADTPYILASVSKPMTATGLMILVDRGKVALDQPVNTYLPGAKTRAFVGDAGAMTIRRLANHTSGMPTHWNFFYAPNTPPPMDDTIAQYAFTAWGPGTRTNYSNLAFGILNYVTEVVSGTDWGTFMESEVYDPAGMPHTSHRIRPGLEDIAAHSYTKDTAGRWVRVTPYGFDHPGASAIWSSANDVARFLLLHMNLGEIDGKRILSTSSAEEMQRIHPDATAAGSRYGVSWAIGEQNGVTQLEHGGRMPGVRTQIVAYPELKSGFVVLTNSGGHNEIARVASELRKLLLPTVDRSKTKAKTAQRPIPDSPRGTWTGYVVDGDVQIPLALEFRDENDIMIRLGHEGRPRKKSTASFNNGRILISLSGRFGSYSHFHGETHLQLDLVRNNNSLQGVLYVDAPDYFRLPYYAELSKNTN